MLWSLGEAGLAGGLQGEAQQQPTHVLRGHSAAVQCVAISSAMRLAVSGSHDGIATLYSNPRPSLLTRTRSLAPTRTSTSTLALKP